jgi:peptide/nickel transport system substrate-binding protein
MDTTAGRVPDPDASGWSEIMTTPRINRRHLAFAAGALPFLTQPAATVVAQDRISELVIDLPSEPESIDPALAYSPRDWSIVHSIYESLLQFDDDGNLVPLAAETFETVNASTFNVKLRENQTFHDGTPVTTDAIVRSVDYMLASTSFMVGTFSVIERVDRQDDLNATIVCSGPAPWLPAQLAAWIVLLPDSFTAESALVAPVGSGPYAVESIEPGNQIALTRNRSYPANSPKGVPIAERVVYRFVPEATTRIADLSSSSAGIVTEIPADQSSAIEDAGAAYRVDPIVGIAYIRLPNDVAPFDDVRVRQALNHAVDVQSIAAALVDEAAHRLSSIYPDERASGFDRALEPYAYDPERARQLLTDAGLPDGFSTEMEITSTARKDIAEAIVGQLGEIGVTVELVTSDYASFNEGWQDPANPPMRMVTWSPLYEPSTLLSLVFTSDGFLSRYSNADLDTAFAESSTTVDSSVRTQALQEIGRILHDDPGAIWLWNLTAGYGVAESASTWTSRGDEYVIPTSVQG